MIFYLRLKKLFYYLPNIHLNCFSFKSYFNLLCAYILFKKQVTLCYKKKVFYIRPFSSDIFVLLQIFFFQDYKTAAEIKASTIIDAGANIGLSSIYFNSLFPNSQIIAIEPEESNYSLLLKNTQDIKNITCINAAIWHKDCQLSIKDSKASKWGMQCYEDDTNKLAGLTISSILKEKNIKKIGLLKIDVEGAEYYLFKQDPTFLKDVQYIFVEPHDQLYPNCSKIIIDKLKLYDFDIQMIGENIFAKKPSLL